MSVIANTPDIEPIEAAIQEHLADPRIPVMRLCKEHGVSRATFYRKLKKVLESARVSALPSPEAVSVPSPKAVEVLPSKALCPEGCGVTLECSAVSSQFLYHLAWECHSANPWIKYDAWAILDERRKRWLKTSVQQSVAYTTGEYQPVTTQRQSKFSASLDSVNTSPALCPTMTMERSTEHESRPENSGSDSVPHGEPSDSGRVGLQDSRGESCDFLQAASEVRNSHPDGAQSGIAADIARDLGGVRDWGAIAAEVKTEVWGERASWGDSFYETKFTPDGEVRDGWDYGVYLKWWFEHARKTSTRNCHTATHPHHWKRRQHFASA